MLIRKLLLPVTLTSVVVMAGCVPAQPQPQKPVLTPDAFSQRIDALQEQLLSITRGELGWEVAAPSAD